MVKYYDISYVNYWDLPKVKLVSNLTRRKLFGMTNNWNIIIINDTQSS